MGRRAVHADPLVPVEGHEREGGVHLRVHDRDVEVVGLADRHPVVDGRAAQWVRADPQVRTPDGIEVDDGAQVAHVRVEEVEVRRVLEVVRPLERGARDRLPAPLQQLVGPLLDPRGDRSLRRSAVGRVVLDAAVLGRIVAGGDDDAVGGAVRARALPVVGEDRVGDRRGGGEPVPVVDHRGHLLGGQHLHDGEEGGLGQGMGVATHEDGPRVSLLAAVVDDRLRRCGDVCLVEGATQAGAAVPRGPERHSLLCDRRIRDEVVVGVEELGDVDEVALLRLLACSVLHAHTMHRSGGHRGEVLA